MRSAFSGAAGLAAFFGATAFAPGLARAGCDLIPTAGNDRFVCDSGVSAGGLVDTRGSNSLTFPPGGTGVLNGGVRFGGGADRIDIASGAIEGRVETSGGRDTLVWSGGRIRGPIDLGGDNDTVLLRGLSATELGSAPNLSGGGGLDSLRLERVALPSVAGLDGWERIAIADGSVIIFDERLRLGDLVADEYGSYGSGAAILDRTSVIVSRGGPAGFFPRGEDGLAGLTNYGLIQLSGGEVGTQFWVDGAYKGVDGYLSLDVVLGDETSAADEFIAPERTYGRTGVIVTPAGGDGALTRGDGILVVYSEYTEPDAFRLVNRVASGPYEYRLARGESDGYLPGSWFLRSTLPGEPDPADDALGGRAAPAGTPLNRPEVAAFSAAAPAARALALASLGTFHERRGDQRLVAEEGARPAAWARLLGQRAEIDRGGAVAPHLDGNLWGVQTGMDLFGREGDGGAVDRLGLFFAYAEYDADVTGRALGRIGIDVGSLDATATSLGASWTRTGPEGWYIDAVIMATWYGGDAKATTGERVDIGGTAATASIEAGRPFAVRPGWRAEPQAQLIVSRLSLDDQRDAFSTIDYGSDTATTGRIGLRVEGDLGANGRSVRPYAVANLWHGFDSDATVAFSGTSIATPLGGTTLEIGAGLVAEVRDRLNLYASADYAADVDGGSSTSFGGSLGLEWRF